MKKDELIEILKVGSYNGKEYSCTYGSGRIENYTIDKNSMYGYDSSGSYININLSSDEFDIDWLCSLNVVTEIWSKNKKKENE